MERYGPSFAERAFIAFVALFVGMFLLTVALPHSWLPIPAPLFAAPFDWLAALTAKQVLRLAFDGRNESDSAGMIAHVLNLTVIASVVALPLQNALKAARNWRLTCICLPRISAYILSWQLLQYGCNKVFKWQFSRPEPNTQYSRIVDLDRDILYWSTMGVSRGYSILLGSVEVLAALLLLFRRTRLAGALMSTAILANVIAINFAFDITVKIFSGFLLIISIVTIWPERGRLMALVGASVPEQRQDRATWRSVLIPSAIITVILADALYPYISSGNFNDDKAMRPSLHGAYEILSQSPQEQGWERLFIHRRGYFILQNRNDQLSDFELDIDSTKQILWVSRNSHTLEYRLDYREKPDTLYLTGELYGDSVNFIMRRLPLRY